MTRTSTQTTNVSAPPRSVAAVPIPTVASTDGKTTTHILIDDYWYDLTAWKNTHPGGPLILEQMNGNDSTDAFYSLHSPEAIARLSRLSRSKSLPAALAGRAPPPPTDVTVAFRAFRAGLDQQGYFTRNPFWDIFYCVSVYAMSISGTIAAMYGHTLLAIVLIGFAMQQAGWIGHDCIHARGTIAHWMGYFISATNAFSRSWWSVKHNTHHVFTNYIGVDADIENDPVFHLFHPEEKDDVIFRKMQHWYFVPVASLLYFSWRTQSMLQAVGDRNWKELSFFLVNYIWLYQLGWVVALGSIYLGGFLVAIIVTATHQSEEMIDPVIAAHAVLSAAESSCASTSSSSSGVKSLETVSEDCVAPPVSEVVSSSVVVVPTAGPDAPSVPAAYSFCEGQFATTRDARTSDPFMEWLWGGMQYQLEHHLFPTMPKYYFSRVAPLVEKFAKENGLSYRIDSQMEIWARNFNTLKHYSGAKPSPVAAQDAAALAARKEQ